VQNEQPDDDRIWPPDDLTVQPPGSGPAPAVPPAGPPFAPPPAGSEPPSGPPQPFGPTPTPPAGSQPASGFPQPFGATPAGQPPAGPPSNGSTPVGPVPFGPPPPVAGQPAPHQPGPQQAGPVPFGPAQAGPVPFGAPAPFGVAPVPSGAPAAGPVSPPPGAPQPGQPYPAFGAAVPFGAPPVSGQPGSQPPAQSPFGQPGPIPARPTPPSFPPAPVAAGPAGPPPPPWPTGGLPASAFPLAPGTAPARPDGVPHQPGPQDPPAGTHRPSPFAAPVDSAAPVPPSDADDPGEPAEPADVALDVAVGDSAEDEAAPEDRDDTGRAGGWAPSEGEDHPSGTSPWSAPPRAHSQDRSGQEATSETSPLPRRPPAPHPNPIAQASDLTPLIAQAGELGPLPPLYTMGPTAPTPGAPVDPPTLSTPVVPTSGAPEQQPYPGPAGPEYGTPPPAPVGGYPPPVGYPQQPLPGYPPQAPPPDYGYAQQPGVASYPGAPMPPQYPDPQQQPDGPWVADPYIPTAEEFARRRAARPTDPVARTGLRGALNRTTLGLAKIAPGGHEREMARDIETIRRNFGGLRQVTVVNPKGGAGKTVAVLLLAMTFGQNRGGYVLAWDNNETQGTLGMRAQQDFHARTVRDILRDQHHFRGAGGRVGDLSQYVRAQGEGMFDVLASDESATAGEMLTAQAFRDIRDVVSRFYKLIFVDTGNNVRAQNWQAAMDATDQLVVTMSARNDSAETAARALDHLEQTGRQRLVRQAVTVVSMPPSRKDIDLPSIQRHFAARTRAVLLAPYERLIDSGEPIRYAGLSSDTREAWLRVAAEVANGL
jgi:MinD-like ATPase involved in chromosome partitioning or flagellar assembly